MDLPPALLDLLRSPAPCFVATLMPDGGPQLTQTWVDVDDRGRILVNSVVGHRKVRNVERDPRVALNVADPADPSSYIGVRGRVVEITTEGAVEHIEALAQKYTGGPYPWYGGRDQQRVLLVIEADSVHSPRG